MELRKIPKSATFLLTIRLLVGEIAHDVKGQDVPCVIRLIQNAADA